MAVIVFYEKPGCGTNARQKRALEAAGHTVIPRNLLTEAWTSDRMRGFFGDTPTTSWFNPAAPGVKSGEIDPGKKGSEAAIALMLVEPILIPRPLVGADGQRSAGFDGEFIASLLANGNARGNLQDCTRLETAAPRPNPDNPRAQS